MGISLVTYAGQTVTPQDDALLYEAAITGSGMIYGGAVTVKNANTLHVDAGHGVICGRKFTIEETDISIPLTASGTLNGRLYIHMDLSDADEPISLLSETAASLTPVVQNTDININNGVYEINIATFTVDTATIADLVDVRPFVLGNKKLPAKTLTAGSTTLVFSDPSITTDSTILPRVNKWGVSPTDITVLNGSATLTFKVQQQPVDVYLIVR